MHGAASMNIAATLLALCSAPLVTSALTSITSSNIKAAAKLWVSDEAQAKAKYGDIADWDTSSVTDMEGIFEEVTEFNADLSKWKVSDVTSLRKGRASEFNADISKWDVGNVRNMESSKLKSCASRDCNANVDFPPAAAFRGATKFNADLSKWDVVNVESMYFTFEDASGFNADIKNWEVSKIDALVYTFANAKSFNGDIGKWNVSKVTNIAGRQFAEAAILENSIRPLREKYPVKGV
eukprot:g1124.t1